MFYHRVIEKVSDLASISPLVVVGARRVNRGGCGGVGQDVDEVWIHHVVVKQVEDAHSIRSICREKQNAESAGFDCVSTLHSLFNISQDT